MWLIVSLGIGFLSAWAWIWIIRAALRGKKVIFACPACSKRIASDEGQAGRQTECPYCGAAAAVPLVQARPAEPGRFGMEFIVVAVMATVLSLAVFGISAMIWLDSQSP